MFAYYLNPYYVKTADGGSYLYVFSDTSEEEDHQMTLIVFTLKNGEIKQVSEMDMGLLYRGNNVYVSNSTIRDCSDGPMNIVDVYGVFEFTNCTLTGSDGFGCFEKNDNCSLTFRNCTFGYRETSYFMFLENITTENCIWSEDYIYPEYGY